MATRFDPAVSPATAAQPLSAAACWQDRFCRLTSTGMVRLPATNWRAPAEDRVADDFVEKVSVGAAIGQDSDRLSDRLASLFAENKRVTLVLCASGTEVPDGLAVGQAFASLSKALGALGHDLAPAALAVPAHWDAFPEIIVEAAAACAGQPDVFAMLSPDLLDAVQRKTLLCPTGARPLPARRRWNELLDFAAADPRFHLVPEESAGPADPMLDYRTMHGPEPGLAQPVTARSARIRLELDVARLVRETRCRPARIAILCEDLVALGDGLLEAAAWPLPELAGHAASRRRLSLHLRELGDAAVLLGGHPERLATFNRLGELLTGIGVAARRASRKLACEAGVSGSVDAGRGSAALRHSHLLVWRPWDFFPPGLAEAADQAAYSHLFPLIRLADSPGWRRRGIEDPGLYGRMLRLGWASWRKK